MNVAVRQYRVFIDGHRAGYVGSGETRSFPISPGQHRVRVKLDWTASRELEVRVPPDAELRCRPQRGSFIAFALTLVRPGRSLQLDSAGMPDPAPNALFIVAGIALWFFVFLAIQELARSLVT